MRGAEWDMKKVFDDDTIERAMKEAGRLAKEGDADIRAGRFVPPNRPDANKLQVASGRRR